MNGPNVLCLVCGAVANHGSLLCEDHRDPDKYAQGDLLYWKWRAQRILDKAPDSVTA